MIKINGATVSWDAYQYGVERDGEVTPCDTPEEARAGKGKPVFRAAYVTGWMEMTQW